MNIDRKFTMDTDVGIIITQHDSQSENGLISAKFTTLDETVRQKIVELITDRQKLDIALRSAVHTSY